MPKKQLTDVDRELIAMDEVGKAYLEYNEAVGGEPIGLVMPFGYPDGVEEHGGVIAVYKECIEKGITWEELLKYHPDEYCDLLTKR
jgi:hypothetical protein